MVLRSPHGLYLDSHVYVDIFLCVYFDVSVNVPIYGGLIVSNRLSHENLRVYQTSVQFLAYASQILNSLPRGNSDLSDQLRRASASIPLNIAEGAGKTGRADAARYFASARGSALECGAVLDAMEILNLVAPEETRRGKGLLVSIASMLSKLARYYGERKSK